MIGNDNNSCKKKTDDMIVSLSLDVKVVTNTDWVHYYGDVWSKRED